MIKTMERSLSILLKKHYQLMDFCLKDRVLMRLIRDNVEKNKPLGLLVWLDIQHVLIEIEPTFLNKLKRVAPNLTVKEKQLCCLLRLHVSSDYISVLLQLSKASIAVYKSEILKKYFKSEGVPLNLQLFLL